MFFVRLATANFVSDHSSGDDWIVSIISLAAGKRLTSLPMNFKRKNNVKLIILKPDFGQCFYF